MFSGRCFIDGCGSKLFGRCECEGTVLFCKEHALEHVVKPTAKGHQCIRLYFKPAEEIKKPIIDKLQALKQDIKKYRIEAIASANEIIKNFKTEFERYIAQIKDAEARCNKIIKVLYSGEEILDIASEDDMENVLKLNASEIQRKMNEWNINEFCLDYKEINVAIKNIYKIPFNPFGQNRENIESNELSFFRHDSKDFVTINLDTFQISSTVTLPTQESIHGHTRSCILPDKTYFYCCNPDNNLGLTFTIDKNKEIKMLQSSKTNFYVDPIFYNNFVYLIGGKNSLAERYDFKQNVWESMASLPKGFNFSYSCNMLYKDSILIAGYYFQKIIVYSIPQNNYNEVPNLALNSKYYKLMMRGNNRVYVLEKGGRTFESSESNISSWNLIGTNSILDSYNQSSVVHYKGSLYFAIYKNQLWKFDLASKQIAQVATL